MTYRLALLLLVLVPIAACGAQDPPVSAAMPAATTTSAAPAATTAPAVPSTTPAAVPTVTEDAVNVAAQGPALVAGSDYVEISGGQPFEPGSGKIEVVEVFGYTCSHCAEFQPLINAWKAKLPADVKLTYVPAPFGGYWVPYAKAYYAAMAMNLLGDSHDAIYRALHIEHSLPIQNATPEEIAQWYTQYGADAKQFAAHMQSFDVNTKLNRALQFIQRSGVDATPTLVVNGKYRVQARTLEDSLRIANQLIAQERAALK